MGISGLLVVLFWSLALSQNGNSDDCNCFRTNGSSAGYFTNHQFHDFRNISNALSKPPAIINNPKDNGNAPATLDFSSKAFASEWTPVSWNNSDTLGTAGSDASIFMVNSPNNIYIEKATDSSPDYTSYLTLRSFRRPTFQASAEIDSVAQNYHYISARFLARVMGSSGACAGMFTYLPNSDAQKIQEADIEILTSGPRNMVQYTNQPSIAANGEVIPQATWNATNPGELDWTQWILYRVDWMPGVTNWYVDGVSVANISFQAPRDPAGLIINMWGDGGSWTGNMSVFDQAYLQLQWIELVYNASGPVGGVQKRDQFGSEGVLARRKAAPGCNAVCSVDEQVNITGTPAFLYKSMGALRWKGDGTEFMIWIPLATMWTIVFGVPLSVRLELHLN